MSESLTNRLFALLVIIWGGIFMYFYLSGRLPRYLAPDFFPYVLWGGLGLLVLGIFSLIGLPEKKAPSHHHDHDDDHHDHHHDEDCETCTHHHHAEGHGPIAAFLITLIPLGVALATTQDRHSDLGLQKKGAFGTPTFAQAPSLPPLTRENLDNEIPRTDSGHYEVSLLMAYYAAENENVRAVFKDLPVVMEGRLIPEKGINPEGNRRRLFRMFVSCCAADGQAVGIPLIPPPDSSGPPNDTWVEAKGTLRYEEVEGMLNPVIQLDSLDQKEEPYSDFILR